MTQKQLARVGSRNASEFVLQYSDGVKYLGYRAHIGEVWKQEPGSKPTLVDPRALPQDVVDAKDYRTPWQHRFKGCGLRALTPDEKAHFDGIKRAKWIDYLTRHRVEPVKLIALEKSELKQYPGGEFLWVRMAKNDNGDYMFSYNWDVSSPDTQLLAIVGTGTEHGAIVFELDGELYSRAYRHEVQGKKRTEYTRYYQNHTSPWQAGSAYMALKPFNGPMIRHTADMGE